MKRTTEKAFVSQSCRFFYFRFKGLAVIFRCIHECRWRIPKHILRLFNPSITVSDEIRAGTHRATSALITVHLSATLGNTFDSYLAFRRMTCDLPPSQAVEDWQLQLWENYANRLSCRFIFNILKIIYSVHSLQTDGWLMLRIPLSLPFCLYAKLKAAKNRIQLCFVIRSWIAVWR